MISYNLSPARQLAELNDLLRIGRDWTRIHKYQARLSRWWKKDLGPYFSASGFAR
jgi:hypothetical protein